MKVVIGAVTVLVAIGLGAAGFKYGLVLRSEPRTNANGGSLQESADDGSPLIESNHRLASGLYAQLKSGASADANIIFSPAGALATLATVLTAETGEAEKEIRKALGLKLDRDRLKVMLAGLSSQLKKDVSPSDQSFVGLQIEEAGSEVVRVKSVKPGSLAAQAGFQVGERIVSIRVSDAPGLGHPIKSAADFVHVLDEAGAIVRVRCQPADEEHFVTRRLRLTGQKKSAPPPDSELQLRITDALWYPRDDRPPLSLREFVEESRDMRIFTVDLPKDADVLRSWFSKPIVEKHSVKLPKSGTSETLRNVFTSAVFCQPKWTSAVNLGQLREIAFQTGKKKEKVSAIPLTGRFQMSKNADFQSVEIPCTGSVALALLVPLRADGLGTVEKKVAESGWSKILGIGELQDAMVLVPELDLASLNDLAVPFSKLGMSSTFGASKKESEEPSKLGPATLLQQVQARVKIDQPDRTSREAKTQVNVDRPFLFVLYNRRTREVLVMGRIVDPANSGG